MGGLTAARICIQCFAVISLLVAIALIFAGMFTAEWQVAEFGPETIHQHGLWKDCEKSSTSNVKSSSEWICMFKFDKQNKEEKHQFKGWQVNVLILLGVSNAIALIAVACALVPCCCLARSCSISWAVFSFLACIVSAAALFLFYRWAHETENRIDTYLQHTVEQHYGMSFWLCVAGSALYLLASFTALIGVIIACIDYKRESAPHKTWPKINHSHNTVV